MKTTMEIKKGVLLLTLIWTVWVIHGTSLFPVDDFDNQVKRLLASQMMTAEEIQKISLSASKLQQTLRNRWKGADIHVFGSTVIGLAFKTSDVDYYLQIPNYNDTADAYIVNETAKLLYKQPEKYSNFQLALNKTVPMIKFYDHSIERFVDLSFRYRVALEQMRLIAYYLSLDDRYQPLAAIVKLWGSVHKLIGKGALPKYFTYLLVVFYLQQKKMLPSVHETQTNIPPKLVQKWNINFEEIPYTVASNETLYELVGGFFKYYSNFNFKDYCVSPFAGFPVAKKYYENVNNMPKEFLLYKKNVKAGEQPPLMLAAMCVQDIMELNSNTALNLTTTDVLKFINKVKLVTKYYDEVSRDRFLISILSVD